MLNAVRRRILTEKPKVSEKILRPFGAEDILCLQQEALPLHNIPQKPASPADPGTDRRFAQAKSVGNLSIGVPGQQFHLHNGPVGPRQTGEAVHQRVVVADRLRRLGKAVPILQRGFSPLLPLERNSLISGDDRNLRGQVLCRSILKPGKFFDDSQKSVMHSVLRVLTVVQDAVRYLVHKAPVFQIYLLKLHLFLRCVEHLQIIDQHRLYLLLPGWAWCQVYTLLSIIGKWGEKLRFAGVKGVLCAPMACRVRWICSSQNMDLSIIFYLRVCLFK